MAGEVKETKTLTELELSWLQIHLSNIDRALAQASMTYETAAQIKYRIRECQRIAGVTDSSQEVPENPDTRTES